jgi:hypothetical protein
VDDSERAFQEEYEQQLNARYFKVAEHRAAGLATEEEYNEAFLDVYRLNTARARMRRPGLEVPSFEFEWGE